MRIITSSTRIIQMIKSRRLGIERLCSTNGRSSYKIYWWESQKKRDHQEDQEVGAWIILRWILEREEAVVWTFMIWLRIGTS
jgi:hypothetical protein